MRRNRTPERNLSRAGKYLVSIRHKTPAPKLDLSDIATKRATSPIKSQNDDNLSARYDPTKRRFTSEWTGDIDIKNFQYALSNIQEKSLSTPLLTKPKEKIDINKIPELISFREQARKIEKQKPDYIRCLRKSFRELKSMNLNKDQIPNLSSITCKIPYGRPNSKQFFSAVKSGDEEETQKFLLKDPFLVHVFDEVGLTALHWASLRNYPGIVSLLLSKRAIIDAIDTAHRTSLFIAVKYNSIECVRILLINMADPHISSNSKKMPVNIAQTKICEKLIKKAMTFYTLYAKLPEPQRSQKWKEEAIPVFEGSYKSQKKAGNKF
ncbi:unnamed protein product [Blepharisma stoltei]|uniref:Ankyrin repeat domain-containing protein n=1 Tax=Blepharisma stoltei TaxID=1481888 RepID=A0AAU9JV98_9CILI|nr:unnamed protein product [Blepharisma stoltei]